MHLEIHCDGSCKFNPGRGGYALIIVKNNKVIDIKQAYSPMTTNNQMELLAIRDAIIYCIEENISQCKIYSDSQYSVNGINEWMHRWKNKNWTSSQHKTIKNIELWKEVEAIWNQATQKLNISLHYEKGHSDNVYNNLADKKANEIIDIYDKLQDK